MGEGETRTGRSECLGGRPGAGEEGLFGNGPWRRRPPPRFMLLVGEMCVFVGLADLMTKFFARGLGGRDARGRLADRGGGGVAAVGLERGPLGRA